MEKQTEEKQEDYSEWGWEVEAWWIAMREGRVMTGKRDKMADTKVEEEGMEWKQDVSVSDGKD